MLLKQFFKVMTRVFSNTFVRCLSLNKIIGMTGTSIIGEPSGNVSIIDWERCDDNSIWISFESAWSPPIALYEYIYHELDWQVEGLYHEGGCAFCGIWKDGDDDFYEYNFDELETLEALPGDLQDFTGLIDYYHDQQQDRIAEEEFQKEEETKTEWFDPTVKPVRVGSYEAKDPEHPNWPFAEFATWDGKKWINGDGKKIKIAKWRGLKEDPNGS
jgi:hypothetical protein